MRTIHNTEEKLLAYDLACRTAGRRVADEGISDINNVYSNGNEIEHTDVLQ